MKQSRLSTRLHSILASFNRLKSIRYPDPELTPENWCQVQPCITIKVGSQGVVITQPSSTVLVYLLGLLTIGAGFLFLSAHDNQISRVWWGISLLLWGIGALLAGTSYQAFGYQIKCAGRETCSWTSWWEVIYLMFQQLSLDAMLVAVVYSCTEGLLQTVLLGYAALAAIVYLIVTFMGAMIPVKSLITFEGMVFFSTPIFLFFVLLNSWRYYLFAESMDAVLVGVWIGLFLTMLAYWLYDKLNITEKLWAKGSGIWFSQNDILHIGLIFWILYIAIVVTNQISDYPVSG